jgi:tRNA (mo5U34)-methyltransferase
VTVTDPEALRREVERYPWYHTLELAPGVVTKGMFDHRPILAGYPLPASLEGLRCLDVGTFDGYWAFEMERRGAASVTAIDAPDPESLDWPVRVAARTVKTMDETKEARFALASEALGSKVRRVLRSVYDLGPDLGEFDFLHCGDLLLHLKDPVTALERMRSVCAPGGSALVTNPIKRFRWQGKRALAELDGVDEFKWWVTNEEGLKRMALAAGFERVDWAGTYELPLAEGPSARGLRGAIRAWV